jgi:CheY-like chemotaxis protein
MNSKVKVFVVDDNVSVLRSLGRLLRSYDMGVHLTTDPYDALEQIARCVIEDELPDVIVTDLNMPHMNGIKLIAEIREIPEFLRIPIILMSAEVSSHVRDMAIMNGAWKCLEKMQIDELPELVLELHARRAK